MKRRPKYTVEESQQGGWNVWFTPEPRSSLLCKFVNRKDAKAFAKKRNQEEETYEKQT